MNQNPYNYGYSNIVAPEQGNYNNIQYIPGNMNIPFHTLQDQYYVQQPEYLSPQKMQMKQIFINNNINNNFQNYNQNINISNENKINDVNNDINNKNIKKNKKDNKVEEVVEDPDEYMFREQNDKEKAESKKDDESELSEDSEKNS